MEEFVPEISVKDGPIAAGTTFKCVAIPVCTLNGGFDIKFTTNVGGVITEHTGISIYSSFGGTLAYDNEYVYQYEDGNNQGFTGWKSEGYCTITLTEDALLTTAQYEQFHSIFVKVDAEGGSSSPSGEPVTIEYNGAVIASLKAGQSASLPCKDLPMLTDLVVSVPEGMGAMEVVTYNGENVVLVEFTLSSYDGTFIASLKAINGMTWEQWVSSEYNTVGIFIDTDSGSMGEVFYPTGSYNAPILSPGTTIAVQSTDVIIPDGAYVHD